MIPEGRNTRRGFAAWSLAGALALAVSLFAVSVPLAHAQEGGNQQDDAAHYGQLLQTIYNYVLQNFVGDEIDPAKLYEGAMKGMFNALGDPHSVFLDAEMLSDLMTETDGTYAGVGLYISKQPGQATETDPKYIEVVSPIEDTPAWSAGIMPGDLIIKIDGESTADLTVDQASSKIKGPAGTKVKLLFRRGSSYEFEVEITRANIRIPPIKSDMIKTPTAAVGYVRIIEWIPQTASRVEEEAAKMVKEGITSLIVDVRSNPGGLLSSVIDVSDLFMDSGVIVSTKGRSSQENSQYKADYLLQVPAGLRMIVLVDRGSASASEIFAGAMKDSRRALLLGEKTYGKGSVQQVFPLDSTGFKLTTARYYTPSGANIDKTGIEPDIVLPDLTLADEQLPVLKKLYDSGEIQAFAKKNPDAGKAERDAFAASLREKGYDLPLDYLKLLVRDELERTKPARVYDMEFDAQLREAVRILQGDDFDALLRNSKTVLEMQAAAKEKAASGAAAPDGR